MGRAFVGANSAANTQAKIEDSHLACFIPGFGGRFQLQRIHGTSLDAKAASLAGFWMGAHAIIGGIHALFMSQFMKPLKPHAAAFAAVADGVRPFLPVGQPMHQARISGLA